MVVTVSVTMSVSVTVAVVVARLRDDTAAVLWTRRTDTKQAGGARRSLSFLCDRRQARRAVVAGDAVSTHVPCSFQSLRVDANDRSSARTGRQAKQMKASWAIVCDRCYEVSPQPCGNVRKLDPAGQQRSPSALDVPCELAVHADLDAAAGPRR